MFIIPLGESVSIVYRFRFDAPSAPASGQCHMSGSNEATTGTVISCDGWAVDDVAFNNDDPDVGYYTDFNGFYSVNN